MNEQALIDWKVILRFMSLLLLVNGLFMLLAALGSLFYQEGVFVSFASSSAGVLLLGLLGMYLYKDYKPNGSLTREGYLIVVLGWILMSLTGSLPYIISGVLPSFTDAFFETMSGYTTVGASIIPDLEQVPHGVLLWRSLTQWIGGMGMIVLAVAILPMLGVGGMQLYAAESPGLGGDKLHPRIADTAKRLWLIYIVLTLAQIGLLNWAGMSIFDAVNHSFASISTGGFSTKNESIAFYSSQPTIQFIITVFMFLGGTNFVLLYYAFRAKFTKVFSDDEFKVYLSILGVFTLFIALVTYGTTDFTDSFLLSLHHGLFQVVSIVTTTGFSSVDAALWTPFVSVILFILMFVGGSAQSTSGGIKIVRYIILWRNAVLEFKRAFHPRAVLPVRYNKRAVEERIVYKILAFFILYVFIFGVGVLIFAALGMDFNSALVNVASTLGNVGGAYGSFSEISNFANHPELAKWLASFLMLVGRLELFTVLILFTPYFWKR